MISPVNSLKGRDFIDVADLEPIQVRRILDLGHQIIDCQKAPQPAPYAPGRNSREQKALMQQASLLKPPPCRVP